MQRKSRLDKKRPLILQPGQNSTFNFQTRTKCPHQKYCANYVLTTYFSAIPLLYLRVLKMCYQQHKQLFSNYKSPIGTNDVEGSLRTWSVEAAVDGHHEAYPRSQCAPGYRARLPSRQDGLRAGCVHEQLPIEGTIGILWCYFLKLESRCIFGKDTYCKIWPSWEYVLTTQNAKAVHLLRKTLQMCPVEQVVSGGIVQE